MPHCGVGETAVEIPELVAGSVGTSPNCRTHHHIHPNAPLFGKVNSSTERG